MIPGGGDWSVSTFGKLILTENWGDWPVSTFGKSILTEKVGRLQKSPPSAQRYVLNIILERSNEIHFNIIHDNK